MERKDERLEHDLMVSTGRHRGTRGSPNPETSRVPPCQASRLLCGVEDVQPLLHLEDHEAGHLQLVWVAALTGRR